MKLSCKLLRLLALLLALAAVATAQQAAAPESEEHHLSKAEAKELFRSIDGILQFASQRTGLPILHPVKKKLVAREEVDRYLEDRLKEQGSRERFDRSALALKKLGLLPRDFNLRAYMLGLYEEQVEGWYDSHNKTVYLLDWIEPELQKPVMAHELVHALQDQNFNLDRWMNVGKDSKDDSEEIALEEARAARLAVVEGQAMIVLFDYQLRSSGQNAAGSSEATDPAKSSTFDEGDDAQYDQAPIYLRESMFFPYNYGTDFVRAILAKRGREAAFAGVFAQPPTDTRQIMQPESYLAGEAQPRIDVVPIDRVLGSGWRREDLSGIGEIDLRVILRQWGGEKVAARLASFWRGGYYMALSKKNAPRDAPIALALVLNLASPDAAHQFAAVYENSLATRYKSVLPARIPHQWTTEEGPVYLYVDGATVIALESFSPGDAAKVHAALMPAATAVAAH